MCSCEVRPAGRLPACREAGLWKVVARIFPENGASLALCRRHGFSEASYYLWRSKFGGMSASDAKRLKELEQENARLKKLVADQALDNAILKEAAKGNF